MSMNNDEKLNILFVCPLYYKPDLPNFSSRYMLLSERFSGDILCQTSPSNDNKKYGNFTLHSMPLFEEKVPFCTLRLFFAIVIRGYLLNRIKPYDVVHCYDPLTLGLAGVVLKMMTSAKLIIEVNGHVLSAGFINRKGFLGKVKQYIYRRVVKCTIGSSNAVKFLNRQLAEEIKDFVTNQKMFTFPDYVCLSHFSFSDIDDKYLLFVGHPFYLKGVDVLVSAFQLISRDFPEYRLVILGHNQNDLDNYKKLASDCHQIEFHRPVFWDRIVEYFERCTFFVLPSRSEAMGRVLLEAMASGKAVVASRVGGIPEVVDDGVTGLLFESENVHDLADKMRILLTNAPLLSKMGIAGNKKANDCFSERHYIDKLVCMLKEVESLNK